MPENLTKIQYPLPKNETARLKSLRSYNILDTPKEEVYDSIVELASQICDSPISMVTLIDGDRQWFKAYKGTPSQQLPREISVCTYAIMEDGLTLIEDSFEDERFKSNPLVAFPPNIRFYAGMPLTNSDGYSLGTLCVMDVKPKTLTDQQKFALKVLSEQVMTQMELKKNIENARAAATELANKNEKEAHLNQLLNRLLLIIAHDFRSPLASLKGMLDLFSSGLISNKDTTSLTKTLSNQVENTLTFLEDLLLWARQKVDGIESKKQPVDLFSITHKILDLATPQIKLKALKIINNIEPGQLVYAGEPAVNLVVRNLITNSIKFCDAQDEIEISAIIEDNKMVFTVSDTGPGMDDETLLNLFKIKSNYATGMPSGKKGTGLGLMLCKDSIEENGGTLFIDEKRKNWVTIGFKLPLPKL